MRKDYNSVNMMSFRKVLERIKFLVKLTNIIIELFKKRKLSIITKFGNTEFIEAGDGINQREVFSFLI